MNSLNAFSFKGLLDLSTEVLVGVLLNGSVLF